VQVYCNRNTERINRLPGPRTKRKERNMLTGLGAYNMIA
jgi:hypothetical protein